MGAGQVWWGTSYLGLDSLTREEEVQDRTRQMLARALNGGRTVAFVGSGLSIPYGYVSWEDLAKRVVEKTLKEIDADALSGARRHILEHFLLSGEVDPGRILQNDALVFVVGECADAFEGCGKGGDLRRFIASQIQPIAPERSLQRDPLELLIGKLRIRRFLTVNYDAEIEKAFRRFLTPESAPPHGGLASSEIDLMTPRAKALVVGSRNTSPEDLTLFAMGAPGYDHGVLHCHGRVDEPETLIVSERDYQRTYYRRDRKSRAFRNALDLAFSSNPILFTGVGLREPDLLRPLRQYMADRPRRVERPLFALLARPSSDIEAASLRKFLHVRYGVHVVYYSVEHPDQHTECFCREIDRIADDQAVWWNQWLRKPRVRRPSFFKLSPRAMIRHKVDMEDVFGAAPNIDGLVAYLSERSDQGACAMLLGPPGSGKGTAGLRLVSGAASDAYDKRFFASAHFSNDLLSTYDGAAAFLGEGSEDRLPLERLKSALRTGKHLLVIGGLERLLTPMSSYGGSPYPESVAVAHPVGRPIHSGVRQFLALVEETVKDGRSHIVLTSSMWPDELDRNCVEVFPLQGISREALTHHRILSEIDSELLKDFHYTLRGHTWAMHVAAALLQETAPERRKAWLVDIVAQLSRVALTSRPEELLRVALEHLRANARPELRRALQCVAFFTTPVGSAEVACALGRKENEVGAALDELVRLRLLDRIAPMSSGAPPRYTAHSVVRGYLLRRSGVQSELRAERQRFVAPGFAEPGDAAVEPDQRAQRYTAECVHRLLQRAESIANGAPRGGDPVALADRLRPYTRGVLGMMRARWDTAGIARLVYSPPQAWNGNPESHCDAYMACLARLVNVLRRSDESSLWSYLDAAGRAAIESDAGQLYVDELAWLINEMAAIAFGQGNLYDAYALTRAVQHVHAVAERAKEGRRYLQSEVTLAVIQLERGSLHRARRALELSLRGAIRIGDKELEARVLGYLAWVAHLRAEHDKAHELYRAATTELARFDNFRALAVFRRLHGDLQSWRGKHAEAEELLQSSIAAAELGQHPELLLYTRCSMARLLLDRRHRDPNASVQGAMQYLPAAMESSRVIGLPKLEAEVYKVMARAAWLEGELERAARLVEQSLSIAAAGGMGLRVASGLVLLGNIASERGDVDAARETYRVAVKLGQRQGYTLQTERAHRALHGAPHTPR